MTSPTPPRSPASSTVGPSKITSLLDQQSRSRESASSPHASSTPSFSSASVVVGPTIAEKAASQDVEDFFARAKAMGLNLTRQDYERARAGVSAFLRAQRVDSKSDVSPVLGESAGGSGSNGGGLDSQTSTERSPAMTASGSMSAKMASHSKLASRSISSPMLSFFTAVLPNEQDDAKARPKLDDVGAMEERKRRRERRRRARERRSLLGESGSGVRHVKKCSLSSTLDGSPLTSVSAETPYGHSDLSQPPSDRLCKVKLLSNESLQGLGLKIAAEDVPDDDDDAEAAGEEGEAEKPNLKSPVQLSKCNLVFESPGLQRLSQKAHIDLDGRLSLMRSPAVRLTDGQENEPVSTEDDEQMTTANTGGETDDSGVFFPIDSAASRKVWGRHRRNTSTETSPPMDLHTSLDRLSFLDRVMAQKASPIRLRKEARAREREAKMTIGSNDLVVMTATASALSTSALADARSADSQNVDIQQGKNVRWARESCSPRRRMTTKEHYDFAFYGIPPHGEVTGVLPTFDEEAEHKRNGGDEEQMFHLRQRTTSAWMRNHLPASNSGSPVAGRGGSVYQSHDSPSVLSLNLDNIADRIESFGGTGLSAKRGLLFGPASSDRTPPGLSSQASLDLADATQVFSQGPTLARSPARNVFDSFVASTPPRFVRANTLAAPFLLQQQQQTNSTGVEESPDRVMLMRAHSSGALERRLPSHSRQASLLTREANKENFPVKKVPTGWAHRSPMGKYETISPAAIFGSQERMRSLSGEFVPVEPSKTARHDEVNSDEEGDDEREIDVSPDAVRHSQQSPTRSLAVRGREWSHTRDSSASTSVFEDSPLYLDIHNRTASVVSSLPSGSTLARALGMDGERAEARVADQAQPASQKTKKKRPEQGQTGTQEANENTILQSNSQAAAPLASTAAMPPGIGRMEWDKPDGSRVVKLVSEELQAALESGTVAAEPPARYYKLPPEWGRSTAKPQSVSYAGMIGQAILSSSDGRLSLNEIYNWISTVFPFFERGDRGWQNSIRHNLSLNKSFIKVEREANIPGKGGWWAIKVGHEDRFRGGSYVAPGSATALKADKAPKSQVAAVDEQRARPDANGAIVRKRQESERSEGTSEHPSDSDYHPSSEHTSKTGKKSKKVKLVGGAGQKVRMLQSDSRAASDGKLLSKVGLQAPVQQTTRVPLRPVQSSSPRDVQFGTITPSRPHEYVASSGHGSTSTTTMANMPMLTDASSPPSSPNHFDPLMPPPSGGVHGAASSQSARKRKQAVSRAIDLMNGSFSSDGMTQQNGFGMQSRDFASMTAYNDHLSHHTLQASPLAHMRGNNAGNGGASLVSNARLRAGTGHSLINAMDSPLRRHSINGNSGSNNGSPTRLFINSPVSSMRASAGHQNQSLSMERSTSADDHGREGAEGREVQASKMMTSPLRGSPLRSSGQFSQQQQQQLHHTSNQFLSPAGLHLQMALGQGIEQEASQGSNGGSTTHFLNYGAGNTPNRYSDQNAGNFLYQRWGLSPSPTKHMRFQLGNGSMHSQGGTPTHNAHLQPSQSNGLEDPFDYSGNLQHELEMATELGQLAGMDGESPMKMAYPNTVRPAFYSGQGQMMQQQQQQAGGQYLGGSSHGVNFAASNTYGLGPSASFRTANSE